MRNHYNSILKPRDITDFLPNFAKNKFHSEDRLTEVEFVQEIKVKS